MIVSCEIMFSANECWKTIEMKMCHKWDDLAKEDHTYRMSESKYFHYKPIWWISINQETLRTNEKTFWLQPSVVYIKQFTPKSWRTTTETETLLEVQTMEIVVGFFLHLVAKGRILVVVPRIQRKSTKEDYDGTVQPVVCRSLAKTSHEFILLCYRYIVYSWRRSACNRRGV